MQKKKFPFYLPYRQITPAGTDKIYKCDLCNREYNNVVQFLKHVSSKHNPDQPVEPAWKCSWCFGLTFEDEESLQKHKNEVHVREKTHRCEICDKMFSSDYQLRKHHANNHFLDEGQKVKLKFII